MTDATEETSPNTPKTASINSFTDVLGAMVGKVVTIVNSESYDETPMGGRLTAGFYKAKILTVGSDYLSVATEFQHKKKGQQIKEPVKQYIPLPRIKRISAMKTELLIHL